MIYFNNTKLKEAKRVLEIFFKQINEEEIYTTYGDINDLYLGILKILSNNYSIYESKIEQNLDNNSYKSIAFFSTSLSLEIICLDFL